MSSFPLVSSELTIVAAELPAGGDAEPSTPTSAPAPPSTAADGCGDGDSDPSSEAGAGRGAASTTMGLSEQGRTKAEEVQTVMSNKASALQEARTMLQC